MIKHLCKICGQEFYANISWRHLEKHQITVKEYYDKFLNDSNLGKCKCCEKATTFYGLSKGYSIYCSKHLYVPALKVNKGIERSKELRQILSDKNKGLWTLEWFCNKYGKEEGIKKYNERSDKTSKDSIERDAASHLTINGIRRYSSQSQELFWLLFNELKLDKEQTYFAELNHEHSCYLTHKRFDFVDLTNKKVIEYNGDKWHANPKFYSSDDMPLKFTGKVAKDIWQEDKEKLDLIKKKGFDVLLVWEYDWKTNKKEVFNTCKSFLQNPS